MTESNYYENNTRAFTPASFTSGDLDFNFYASDSDAWYPSKSYIRVGLNLLGAGGVQPTASQLIALADNACGNLFVNASLRAGPDEISACRAGLPQVSALAARTKSFAWLKSIARGAELSEPKFSKRVMNTASGSPPDSYLNAINEMYKPVAAGAFNTATVSISIVTVAAPAITKPNASFVGGPAGGIVTNPVVAAPAAANPYSALVLANAITDVTVAAPIVIAGGSVIGNGTLFASGMPNLVTNAPTGGSLAAGDILVVNGVYYPIVGAVGGETALNVANAPNIAIVNATDWYIIRKDLIRAPQSGSSVFAI